MIQFRFKKSDAVRRLVEKTKEMPAIALRTPYDNKEASEPIVYLAKDEGAYLMPAFNTETFPGWNRPCDQCMLEYAVNYPPAHYPGDDWVIPVPLKWLEQELALHDSEFITLEVYSKQSYPYEVRLQVAA